MTRSGISPNALRRSIRRWSHSRKLADALEVILLTSPSLPAKSKLVLTRKHPCLLGSSTAVLKMVLIEDSGLFFGRAFFGRARRERFAGAPIRVF